MPAGTVVLLHGIGRTALSMRPLLAPLRGAGYATFAPTYPSRRLDLETISLWLQPRLAPLWEAGPVHFVTHSMGGLVAARYLEDRPPSRPAKRAPGRVVMLAPPLRGSEIADALLQWPLYRWFYGPAGSALTTTRTPLLPAAETGVIAGSVGWPYLLGGLLLPGVHDGRVAMERTRHPGLADHLVVPATHSFIMGRRDVHEAVLAFLATGRFALARDRAPH